MEKTKRQIKHEACKIRLADGLRKWQQNSVRKQCPLKNLAQKLGTSIDVLRNMLKNGLAKAKRRSNAKKNILVEAKTKLKYAIHRRFAIAETKTKALAAAAGVGGVVAHRTCARLVSPLRRETAARRSKYWKNWHRRNPNRGISDEEWLCLSQRSCA
jgi:hypothetical protein